MKTICTGILLLFGLMSYSQSELTSEEPVYKVLVNAERGRSLKSSEMLLLLQSYDNSVLKNNVEFSEWRSEIIISILNHPKNLKKLLHCLNKNMDKLQYVLDELSSPVNELNVENCVNQIKKIKGSEYIKEEFVKAVLKSS